MSRLRVVVAALAAMALAAPSAQAVPQGKQKPKIDVEASVRAQLEAQRQQEQGAGDGNGGPGDAVNGVPDAEIDPEYLAQIRAITGKKMTATFTNAPPEIDGSLNDPEWNFAEPISDFLQRDPDNGEPGSERTEVRVLYDDDAIYFGFTMYDNEPGRIIAQDLRRDSRLETDDTITVLMDTYHDRRNGFIFAVNALGTMYDAELRNERQVNSDWDEKWEAAAQITAEGWIAEVKIPFRVLRYNTGSHVWGIDFKREIRRKNEEVAWSNHRRGFQFNSISQGGNLVGLENLGLTQRFRIQPYVTGSDAQFNITEDPNNVLDGNLGIENFKIQLTPNLTADTTFNTDFAQVEDDNERVNLTRFPLSFPEKRDFFLESADNFSFGSGGGRGFGGRGGGFGGGDGANLFYSRNIGLAGGQSVPIIYGAKITGKVGSTNVGMLNVQTDSNDDNPGQNYTGIRLKQDIFARSSVGMLFTNVAGGGDYNRVAGVDASFRFFDYLSFSGQVAAMQDTDVEGNPITGRFGAGWHSDAYNVSGSYERIDSDFDSDLGFIRRRGIQSYDARVGWNPRPSWAPMIRQFRLSSNVDYVADIDGEILTRDTRHSITTSFQSGDRITFNYSTNFERLDREFEISDGIFIFPGDYAYNTWWLNYDGFDARKISARVNVSGGGFWDGTKFSVSPGGTIRFNEKFSLSPSWNFNRVELPGGSFDTQVVSTRIQYNFSDRWLTNSLVQYNSDSGRMSVFARLRFVYNTIDNFYLVYKSSTLYEGVFYGQTDHQVIAKMTYSLDF